MIVSHYIFFNIITLNGRIKVAHACNQKDKIWQRKKQCCGSDPAFLVNADPNPDSGT